jgi:hypothetical protein
MYCFVPVSGPHSVLNPLRIPVIDFRNLPNRATGIVHKLSIRMVFYAEHMEIDGLEVQGHWYQVCRCVSAHFIFELGSLFVLWVYRCHNEPNCWLAGSLMSNNQFGGMGTS